MNRRRLLAAIGTGATAGLAGCGGATDGGGDGSGTPGDDGGEGSDGEGDGPDGGTESTDGPFPDAAWLDGDALDVEAVAELHREALVEAGGYTLFSTAESTYEGAETPESWLPSQEYESTYDSERGRQYLRQELLEDDRTEVSEAYVDGTEAFFREVVGDQVAYDRRTVERTEADLETAMREEAVVGIRVPRESEDGGTSYEGLTLWNPTVDGDGEVRGEPTARFVADAFDGDRTVPEEVADAAATVHVREAGIVPRIEQSWTGPHAGAEATVDVDIDYRAIGESLAEPDWVDDAREATAGTETGGTETSGTEANGTETSGGESGGTETGGGG